MLQKEITTESVIIRTEECLSTDIDGEVVLMTIPQGNYYSMNKSLSRIWGLLENPISVYDICRKLMEEFEVDREKCEKDIMEVLMRLANENLISLK